MKSRTSHPPLFPGPSLFLESRLYSLGYFYKLNWINVILDIYAYLAKKCHSNSMLRYLRVSQSRDVNVRAAQPYKLKSARK